MAGIFVAIGSLAAMLGVVLGAFGAHGLRGRIPADLLAVYQTGVQYHLLHALGLIMAGLILRGSAESRLAVAAGWLFLTGIVLFSGSLYLLALTGHAYWGAVTPFGGVAFIAGWLALAGGAVRR